MRALLNCWWRCVDTAGEPLPDVVQAALQRHYKILCECDVASPAQRRILRFLLWYDHLPVQHRGPEDVVTEGALLRAAAAG